VLSETTKAPGVPDSDTTAVSGGPVPPGERDARPALPTTDPAGTADDVATAADGGLYDEFAEVPPEEILAMMTEAGEPGEPHDLIAQMEGEFAMEMRFWEAPDQDPEPTSGIANNRMDLGGRFLVGEMRGEFNFGGETVPIEGRSILGYNNLTEEVESTWVDTFTTATTRDTGSIDGNAITTEGTTQTPFGPSVARRIYTIHSTNRYTLEFFEQDTDGSFIKTGEIEYRRIGG
ncbi:MAG: DUF1579 family protein, partial [Planctomycetota bacterium]